MEHQFANNVRFLSMAAVVCLHSSQTACKVLGAPTWLSLILAQPLKFGTIGFFLISGFLMGDASLRRGPAEYMKRRLLTVASPWAVWFLAYFSMWFTSLFVTRSLNMARLHGGGPLLVLGSMYHCMFASNYWFVPNLLIGVGILLTCRRFLFDGRFGCVLLALSVLHGVNIYSRWLPMESHTKSLFGFVFYLWLGAWCWKRKVAVLAWIERFPNPLLWAITVLSAAGSLAEGLFVAAHDVANSGNSLRLCNQVFSVAVVMLVVKARGPIHPRSWDVRTTTFGIYLSHGILIGFMEVGLMGIDINGRVPDGWITAAVAPLLAFCMFAVAYLSCLRISQALWRTERFHWMVGNFQKAPRAAQPVPAMAGS